MRLLEQRIREYEHARWTTDDNRRVLPFEWGLEHIGGRRDDPDPRGYLNRWVPDTIAQSEKWFATTPPESFEVVSENGARGSNLVLTFPSGVQSPWAENNRVVARYFPARSSGAAVVVLANWNAKWNGQIGLCRWLNALGITALKMSMPYHDRRAIPGHERADYLVGPNIGLTLQANRQAVVDTRRCLRWLESQGYSRLGLLGISIGASVGSITLAHDRAVRAGAFLHVSRNFGDVVRTGITTAHVWEGLRNNVNETEIAKFWSPISPHPYIGRVAGSPQRMLVVTAKYDPSMWPELSEQMIAEMREKGVEFELLRLPCGHYSLELPPFSWAAGGRLGRFLFENLG